MQLCYLDESGGYEAPDEHVSAIPVMVLIGLILDVRHVAPLTEDFLAVKRQHFPAKFRDRPSLNHVLVEVKGSDILKLTRSNSRDRRRQADRLRLDLLALLAYYRARLVGRVWVKGPSRALEPTATYCYAVQDICRHFSRYAISTGSMGIVAADFRQSGLNSRVAHSIFTQKWRAIGDPYPGLADVPFFADSTHHVGLQLADLVASSLIFPIACAAYGHCPQSAHSSQHYAEVRNNFSATVENLQFRYQDERGRWRGGIVVSDRDGRRSGSLLFRS